MGKNKLTLGACLFLFSCINHSNKDAEVSQYWQIPSNKTEVQYAKGFEIEYFSDYTLIVTQSLAGNSSFKDSVFLPYFEQANIPKNAKYLLPENLFVACQSSTHLSYLKKLGQLEKVKGVCGMDYIEDHNLLTDLESN